MKFITVFFDFFLPRFCASCNTILTPDEKIICSHCLSNIKRADDERIASEFGRKFENDKIISGFRSLFIFEKEKELQNVIHELKYNGMFGIGKYFGRLIGNSLYKWINECVIDFIIPVPLHHLKRADRGYNQSFYIAKGISTIMNIPVRNSVIKRKRYTNTQTELSLTERKENVLNAFILRSKKNLKDKNVLLVDDVITTGATITECARILLCAGAKKVFAVSVAIAD